MNRVALVLISLTKSEIAMSGVMPTRIWMWSGIELIWITFCFLFAMMPTIYLWSSDLCCFGVKDCLASVAKTTFMERWGQLMAIWASVIGEKKGWISRALNSTYENY